MRTFRSPPFSVIAEGVYEFSLVYLGAAFTAYLLSLFVEFFFAALLADIGLATLINLQFPLSTLKAVSNKSLLRRASRSFYAYVGLCIYIDLHVTVAHVTGEALNKLSFAAL